MMWYESRTVNPRLFSLFALLSLMVCATTLLLQFQGDTCLGDAAHSLHLPLIHPYALDDFNQALSAIPLYTVTVLTVLPLIFATRHLADLIKLHRTRYGLCPECAYDLTANTTGICPECGTPIARQRSSSI
jgi:hypothetical protein